MITNEDKKKLVEQKIRQLELRHYEFEMNVKMQEAYGERKDVIDGTKNNALKQAKALEVLYAEFEKLK